jgi:hypothetical protein
MNYETIEQADNAIARLQAKADQMTRWHDDADKLRQDTLETIIRARNLIEETLATDIDADQTFEDFREAFELLGVKMTETKEYTVTAVWTVSMKHPRGYDMDDVAFDADLTIEDSDAEFDGYIPSPEMTWEVN